MPTQLKPRKQPRPRQPSRAARFGQIIDKERKDTSESLEALRLQVRAWRILAIIGLADPERGKREAGWLLMNSFPWINASGLRKFIAEREEESQRLGIEIGLFDK